MKRRIILILLPLFFAVCLVSPASFAADRLPDLGDEFLYYTDDYVSGDCILSSAKSLLRRAAVSRGSYDWDSITNTSLRGYATYYGTSFRNSFSYANDGISYEVVNQEIYGDAAEKTGEVADLIVRHPEGVIIWGPDAAENGPHAVLVTGYSGGELYAVDSVYNTYDFNEGIQRWDDTTMKTIDFCTNVWYLSDIEGGVPRELWPDIADISASVAAGTESSASSAQQSLSESEQPQKVIDILQDRLR